MDFSFLDKVFLYAVMAWMWKPTRYAIIAAVAAPWAYGVACLFN